MRVGLRREMYQKSGVVTLRRSRSFLYCHRPSPAIAISTGTLAAPLAVNLRKLDRAGPFSHEQLRPQARRGRSELPRPPPAEAPGAPEAPEAPSNDYLSMTCCACETRTTGIAGPLVRYLPPQKLSPTLLTHSLAAVRAMPNPATSLRTRNCPRYGGIGDDHPTEYNCTLLERHHDDGPLRLTASREATLPQYPALGAWESGRRGISANVQ